MKQLMILMAILLWATSVGATGIVDNGAGVAEDSLSIPIYSLDSIGTPQAIAAGDSVYVITFYANGAEAFRDSMAGNDGSITTSAWEDFAGVGFSNYKEGVDNLDGTANEGVYSYVIVVDDVSLGLETLITGNFQLYDSRALSETFDFVDQSVSTVDGDVWTVASRQLTALDEDVTTMDLDATTVGGVTNQVSADITAISGDAPAAESLKVGLDGGIPTYSEQLAKMAYFDTLIYMGAIWIDDGAANTNTVLGADGTPQNPVSTLAAARTIANALNSQQYNILNASSFTLAAAHESWFFCGIGHNNMIDFGSQDIDDSHFDNVTVTGTQGGTGTIRLTDCDITDLHDFDGEALFCWLVDSLVMDNNSNAFFGNCYSEVAGNGTPTIDFHIASNNVAFRNYSGGINIVNMSDNDKLSIEGNGQIIVDATCTSAPITARGNFSITDNGTTTAWTYDAVYNKGFVRDTIWVDGQDLVFDSLHARTLVINNSSGTGTGLHVQGSGHGAYIRTTGTGTSAIYADGSGGAHTNGIKAEEAGGDGFDIAATLNFDNIEGTLDASEIGTAAIGSDELADDITIPKLTLGGFFMDSLWIINDNGEAIKITTTTGGDHAIGINAVGRGISINAATGIYVAATTNPGIYVTASSQDAVVFTSSANNKAGLLLQGTGTSSIGLKVAGVERDYDGTFDSTNFAQDGVGALDSSNFSAQFWDAIENAGGAASITDADMAAIADSVWQALLAGHSGVAGSFGDSAKGWGATGAGGSGNRLCSLYVYDGSSPMTTGKTSMTDGVDTWTVDLSESGAGWAVFNLTDATWTGLSYTAGFAQDTIPQTFVVTTSFKDTITVTAQTVAGATNPALVKVYAWTDNILGDTLPGAKMTAKPIVSGYERWVAASGRIVLPREETAIADDSGFVFLNLYPTETTNNEDGDSLYYDIEIHMTGYGTAKYEKFLIYDDSTGNTQAVQEQ